MLPHLPRWPSLVSRIHPNLGTGSGKPKETEGAIYSFRLRFARWRVIRRTADSRRALVATKPILGLARSAVRPSCRGVRLQFTEWSREPALNDQSCRVLLHRILESPKAWCRFNYSNKRMLLYFTWNPYINPAFRLPWYISIWDTRRVPQNPPPSGATFALLFPVQLAHRHIGSIVNFSTWSLTAPLALSRARTSVRVYAGWSLFFERPRGKGERYTYI